MSFLSYFFYLSDSLPASAEKGIYQLPLVVLSYLVASFASYTALSMAQHLVEAGSRREKYLLHWGGAFAMGAGIWSMHFIGMLSYKMRMLISYDPFLTLLSMIIAIVVAYGVLSLVARPDLSLRRLLIGAVLLGLGICGMHYTGMAAMQMDSHLRYIPSIFGMSVAIAIAASAAALWMVFNLSRHAGRFRELLRVCAALIMGAAICGMHYTGMAAAVFLPFADCRYAPDQNFDMLALAIAIITAVILGIALSVGAYKKAQTEIKLYNSEARLRLMINSSPDAVVAMDHQGQITEWNRQAEEIFGWSHTEVAGRQMKDLIIPVKYREGHAKGMQRFMKEGIGPILGTRIELQGLKRDGTEFPVELTVSAQKLARNYHFTAFIRDISESKETEARLQDNMKELQRSNQELEEFAHIASHDLKEPLRGLYSQASFLLEDYQDKLDEKGVQRLNRLIYLSKRMEHLVSDLLYFSQLNRVKLAVMETDPNALVDEIRLMLETFLKERNARIIVPKSLPHIICDKPRITEVFRNLITNAVKYNDKPERLVEVGFLETALSPEGPEKNVFYVRDNGIGIAPEFHQEIFRIFKRLTTANDDKETGTGVGLTFVKKIIERHQGYIWLESTPGKGTTFYFTLDRRSNHE